MIVKVGWHYLGAGIVVAAAIFGGAWYRYMEDGPYWYGYVAHAAIFSAITIFRAFQFSVAEGRKRVVFVGAFLAIATAASAVVLPIASR